MQPKGFNDQGLIYHNISQSSYLLDLRDDALICQAPEFTHCIADIPTDEFNLQGINAESTSCFPTQVAADYPQQSAFRKPYKRDCKRPSHCFEKTWLV